VSRCSELDRSRRGRDRSTCHEPGAQGLDAHGLPEGVDGEPSHAPTLRRDNHAGIEEPGIGYAPT
jgi:hypothetical protein